MARDVRTDLRQARWRATLRAVLIITVISLFLLACTAKVPRPTGTLDPTMSRSPQPFQEILRIGLDVTAGGWVVLPEWSGVWVAGGGTLSEIEDSGRVRITGRGRWDYDYVQMARYGEGSILLASGTTLWTLDANSGGVIDRLDLGDVGYVDAVLSTRSGTWIAASGNDGGVLARLDDGTGDVLQAIRIGDGRHELIGSIGYLVVSSHGAAASGVVRVDRHTGATATLSEDPGSIASVGSRIWIAADDHVRCVDVVDLSSCGEIAIPRVASLASDGARLWVLTFTGSSSGSSYLPDEEQPATVTLVDGVNGQIVAGALPLPSFTPATISAFDGHAWVGFHDDGRVLRIGCGEGRCSVPGWDGDQST
jgi:WD40 repeat protein